MKMPASFRLASYGLLTLILIGAITAVAAANTVPSTRMTSQGRSIYIDNFRPAACAVTSLTSLVTGSGVITGTEGNDLILAGSGADMIDGLGGDDCIVGGGGTDICTGGLGTDIFVACETQIQ